MIMDKTDISHLKVDPIFIISIKYANQNLPSTYYQQEFLVDVNANNELELIPRSPKKVITETELKIAVCSSWIMVNIHEILHDVISLHCIKPTEHNLAFSCVNNSNAAEIY